MTTKTEIVNLALAMISANLVSNLSDKSDEARLANINDNIARDATLQINEWSWSVKRFMPAKDADTPLFGWGFQFTVPSDILRVLTCERIGDIPVNMIDPTFVTQYEQDDWQIEDGKILANVDVIYARGIRRVTEEGKYSPLFVNALAAKLGMMMAFPLTQSTTIFEKAAALYAAFVSEAKTMDSIQGRSRRIRNKSLLRAR